MISLITDKLKQLGNLINPDRVAMPDIDIDTTQESRAKVIDYIKEKYPHINEAKKTN